MIMSDFENLHMNPENTFDMLCAVSFHCVENERKCFAIFGILIQMVEKEEGENAMRCDTSYERDEMVVCSSGLCF